MFDGFLESITQLPILARFTIALTVILVLPPLCQRVRLPAVVGLLAAGVVGQGPVPDGSPPDVGPEAVRQGGLDGLERALGLGGPPAELLKQSMTFAQQVTDSGWFFLFQRPSLVSPLVESA